jgi:hypothetical protein
MKCVILNLLFEVLMPDLWRKLWSCRSFQVSFKPHAPAESHGGPAGIPTAGGLAGRASAMLVGEGAVVGGTCRSKLGLDPSPLTR